MYGNPCTPTLMENTGWKHTQYLRDIINRCLGVILLFPFFQRFCVMLFINIYRMPFMKYSVGWTSLRTLMLEVATDPRTSLEGP